MIKEFQKEYRWLNNFAPVKITLDNIDYYSVEHAYMSAKSDNIEWKKFCSDSENKAGDVKRKSKTLKVKDNWNEIKIQIMRECIKQKFNQEPYKTKLLNTGTEYIQEGNMWNDKFWGVCLKTNKGQNNLGKLIMEIRNQLKH